MSYSVVMSVYHKENPIFLQESIHSMLGQTVPPADFVVVADGPLTDGINSVLHDCKTQFPDLFQFLWLNKNEGQGVALQKGLVLCKYELVARMDSDDISVPERCGRQLKAFEENPELDLVGGQMEEFDKNSLQPYARRSVPLSHEDILKFAQKRNPFNHMTVMFKKSAVLRVGNYQHFPLLEDYWLWVKLLQQGARTCNLPEVLVKARAGKEMLARRGGVEYTKKQLAFQKVLYRNKFISYPRFLSNVCVRVLVGVMPGGLRKLVYKGALRNAV